MKIETLRQKEISQAYKSGVDKASKLAERLREIKPHLVPSDNLDMANYMIDQAYMAITDYLEDLDEL